MYFATAPTSQKAGNIELNNKVSVAIVNHAEDFHNIRGLCRARRRGWKTDKGLKNLLCDYLAGFPKRGGSSQKIQRSLQSTKSGAWLLR